jgi:hypothetical protein
MHKNALYSFSFCAALLAAATVVRADCVQDLDKFETSFDERLKTEGEKAAAHPMILKMADGQLVDMRGTDADAEPKERWFVTDRHAVDSVRTGISEARQAFSSGDTTGCESRYNELRTQVN